MSTDVFHPLLDRRCLSEPLVTHAGLSLSLSFLALPQPFRAIAILFVCVCCPTRIIRQTQFTLQLQQQQQPQQQQLPVLARIKTINAQSAGAVKGFSRTRSRSSSGSSEMTNGQVSGAGNASDLPGGGILGDHGSGAAIGGGGHASTVDSRSVGGGGSPASSLMNGGVDGGDFNSEHSGEGAEDHDSDRIPVGAAPQGELSAAVMITRRAPASAAVDSTKEGRSGHVATIIPGNGVASSGGVLGGATGVGNSSGSGARNASPSAGGGEFKHADGNRVDHPYVQHHHHPRGGLADCVCNGLAGGYADPAVKRSSSGSIYQYDGEIAQGPGRADSWSRVRARGRATRHHARIRPTLGPGASPISTPRNASR